MKYTIWLQLCLRQGSKSVSKVFEKNISPKEIFSMSNAKRESLNIFSERELEKLSSVSISKAQEIIKECKKSNIKLISYLDKAYPDILRELINPPLVLYVKGDFPDFSNTPAIAIVGPRKVSDFGKKAAYALGYRLAKSGITVISGGAVGSDRYAHIGALKSGGKTVLIMPCGFNVNYLKENSVLRGYIENQGCLITEYPPDVKIARNTFHVRNRLIAALSLGTVVIEAGVKSGVLITANHAIEQGKDVFVIPGSPEKEEYKGSNLLLRDGAKPLLDASDIFNEYITLYPDKINIEKAFEKAPKPIKPQKNKKILNETLSNEAKIVYNCLNTEKFYPDELNTGLSSTKLLSALTELEMEFIIKALPGGQYEICK